MNIVKNILNIKRLLTSYTHKMFQKVTPLKFCNKTLPETFILVLTGF